jgi:hypothetical protein
MTQPTIEDINSKPAVKELHTISQNEKKQFVTLKEKVTKDGAAFKAMKAKRKDIEDEIAGMYS